MRNRKSLIFFLLGTTAILIAAAGLLLLLHRHPAAAFFTGAALLIAGAGTILFRRLPLWLAPRREAERQLTALLRKSTQATLLYYDSPEEEAGPALVITTRVERREGLEFLRLTLPAEHPDLPALLTLPSGAELTLVLLAGPTSSLQFSGTISPLAADGDRGCLRFAVRTLRLPHLSRPLLIQPAKDTISPAQPEV